MKKFAFISRVAALVPSISSLVSPAIQPAIVLAFLMTALLSACSGSDGAGGEGRVVEKTYDPALCKTILPSSGGAADYAQIGVKDPVESAYFEKRYNRAMLKGVLAASGVETQKYVIRSGIDTYKIPYTGNEDHCLFQHDLAAAPAEPRADWDKRAGGDHGGGFLDGLFVYWRDKRKTGWQTVIMVREDASRWTLVHEMMHANFFFQSLADGEPLEGTLKKQIDAHFDVFQKALTSYRATQTLQDYNIITEQIGLLTRLHYKALVSGPLEEIADESLLLEEFSKKTLGFVSARSAANAAWYINYSREASLEDLNDFAKVVNAVRGYVKTNPPAVPAPPPPTGQNSAPDVPAAPIDQDSKFVDSLDFIASVNQRSLELVQIANDRTHGIPKAYSMISKGFVELTNAHVANMANTPGLLTFRRHTVEVLATF